MHASTDDFTGSAILRDALRVLLVLASDRVRFLPALARFGW
jgi:hypothetical protein